MFDNIAREVAGQPRVGDEAVRRVSDRAPQVSGTAHQQEANNNKKELHACVRNDNTDRRRTFVSFQHSTETVGMWRD